MMTKHAKIELPKFMCEWLDKQLITLERYPMGAVAELNEIRVDNDKVATWLNADSATQWLLIDALHYGYVSEPHWGIKHKGAYLHNFLNESSEIGPYFNLDADTSHAWIANKWAVEKQRDYLGFGEVVDMNKEVADD